MEDRQPERQRFPAPRLRMHPGMQPNRPPVRIGSRIKLNALIHRITTNRSPILPPSLESRERYKLSQSFNSADINPNPNTDNHSSLSNRKKKERKLFTKARKKWKNVGRRFSSPFASLLRTNRKTAKLKGERGTLLLFDTDTKHRVMLAEQIERAGYNVEQHSIADKAMACLRQNSSIQGALVAINSKLLHDSSLDFLRMLDAVLSSHRLFDIAVALLPSSEDCQVIEAAIKDGEHHREEDLLHLRRGISPTLEKARKFNHVRVELRVPSEEREEQVEQCIVRFEEMTKREIAASGEYSKSKAFDFKHKKQYLKMLERRKYSSGHRALNRFVDRPRQLKIQYYKKWKEVWMKGRSAKTKKKADTAKLKKGMMGASRKKALMKLFKTKAKSVSAAKRVWQRSVASNITHDRLIKRTILPTWLPLRMRRLYLAPDTTSRDLERAVEIFNRMVLRRSEVWPRACRAMAYCLLSEASTNEATSQKYLKKAEKELTICLKRKPRKDRGDLLYNRSVVRVRQGHIELSIEDLTEVIHLYNEDKRHVSNEIYCATLHNRSFIQRRFGNFVTSFADLSLLHNTIEARKKKGQKEEKDEKKGEAREDRGHEEQGNRGDDEGEHEIWYNNNNDDDEDGPAKSSRSSPTELEDTTRPNVKSLEYALHPMLALDSFDATDTVGVPLSSSLSSSSSSSSSSDSDSSSEEEQPSSMQRDAMKPVASAVRKSGGRRSSMIGNVGSVHNLNVLSSTKKKQPEANKAPGLVDHTESHSHALEMLQNFSDSVLEKKLGDDNTKKEFGHSAIEIVMMNKKQKDKAIEAGLKHMFNKTLPTNVYDALHVPLELRTRKHWNSIRFVTDTMKAFADYPELLKNQIVKILTFKHSLLDAYICREGDPSDNFYVIVSGYLRVEVKHPNDKTATIVVNRMGPGTSFGELSLVFDQNRAASVISDSKNVSLLVIPKEQFHDLGLAQFHLALLQDKYQTLCQNKLFDSWSDEALTALAQIAQVKTFKQHTEIVKQDSRPDYFHILRKGVVNVLATTDQVAELKREESELSYKLDRSRNKLVISKLIQADRHVQESKADEQSMKNRLKVVKKQIQRCMLLPKPKISTQIATLFAPSCFGESSVIAPNRGEVYTVIADTNIVETLQIARAQIKSKWISPTFVAALKRGMVHIPPGEELRKMEIIRQSWNGEKSEICKIINTDRHPHHHDENEIEKESRINKKK